MLGGRIGQIGESVRARERGQNTNSGLAELLLPMYFTAVSDLRRAFHFCEVYAMLRHSNGDVILITLSAVLSAAYDSTAL